jgi:hypothetical protein
MRVFALTQVPLYPDFILLEYIKHPITNGTVANLSSTFRELLIYKLCRLSIA